MGKRGRRSYYGNIYPCDRRKFRADASILATFKAASLQLTQRHDQYEKLVKLSRDVTIESKRIISLLLSPTNTKAMDKAVGEANYRISVLINGPLKAIALEQENYPAYLYSRAVSPGYQEFVEAITFYSLMEREKIVSYPDVKKRLTYQLKDENDRIVVSQMPFMDFVLGVADLTGELMRRSINSIINGDTYDSEFACRTLKTIYAGFTGLTDAGKEFSCKINTARKSVCKAELAVYAVRVRVGEKRPIHLLSLPPWDIEDRLRTDDAGHLDEEDRDSL